MSINIESTGNGHVGHYEVKLYIGLAQILVSVGLWNPESKQKNERTPIRTLLLRILPTSARYRIWPRNGDMRLSFCDLNSINQGIFLLQKKEKRFHFSSKTFPLN